MARPIQAGGYRKCTRIKAHSQQPVQPMLMMNISLARIYEAVRRKRNIQS